MAAKKENLPKPVQKIFDTYLLSTSMDMEPPVRRYHTIEPLVFASPTLNILNCSSCYCIILSRC
eukprot:scaffold5186_cov152-Skeletonema_menzelii.AAC.1